MSLSPIILLVTGGVCSYYSYFYIWYHAIDLFETYQVKETYLRSNSINDEGYSFIKLISQKDDWNDDSLIRHFKVVARVVFTLTITTTVLIMEIILLQLLNSHGDTPADIDSFSSFIWQTSILIILMNLIILQPLIISLLMINKLFKSEALNNRNMKLSATVTVMIVWLIFVARFDYFTDFNNGTFFVGFDNWISIYFHKVAIIGITLISILNGIGSYSTFYYYLFLEIKNRRKGDSNDKEDKTERLSNLKKTLDKTEDMISAKRVELKERDSSDSPHLSKRTNILPKGSFLDLKILNTLKTDKEDELSKEIKSLVKIKNDVSYKIIRVEESLNTSTYLDSTSSYYTNPEFIKNLIQKTLAIYCLFKMIQVTTVKIISLYQSYGDQDRTTTKESDPLVITVVKIIQLFITIQDEEFLINVLNFLVSGVLFICSFNGVFLSLRHLYKFIPIDLSKLSQSTSSIKHKSVSIVKNLIISELMGIYGLATLLILKSSLTNNFRITLMSLLTRSTLTASSTFNLQDIYTIDSWFDKVYLISVIITITGIRISEVFGNEYDGIESQVLSDKIV